MIKILLSLLLTRTGANTYYDHKHDRTFHTRDCTVTARLMDARLESYNHHKFLVFVGADGEDEGECELQ